MGAVLAPNRAVLPPRPLPALHPPYGHIANVSAAPATRRPKPHVPPFVAVNARLTQFQAKVAPSARMVAPILPPSATINRYQLHARLKHLAVQLETTPVGANVDDLRRLQTLLLQVSVAGQID
jgi:hypothetical protein